MEICIDGATCEFFFSCWLSGGLLDGPCEGFLRACCHKGSSKTGQSHSQAIGTIEAPRESPKSTANLLDSETSKWYRTLGLVLV